MWSLLGATFSDWYADRFDPSFGQALSVPDRQVLPATVTVMNERLGARAGAIVEGVPSSSGMNNGMPPP
jgi:hypothetical protein